jgi:transcriptional regulator with XRE-family HTH domain
MESPGVDQVVAFNLRRWRTAAGLTQEELGERIGWSGANVSSAERSADPGRDKRRFDAALLVALASALGVPLIALFLPPPDADGKEMAELFARVLPETPDDSPVMEAYRRALADAAERHLDIADAASLVAYLQDMTDPEQRHARAAQRISDLRAFERDYRRRLRAYLEDQLAELGPPEEDS